MTVDAATLVAILAAVGGVISAIASYRQARNARAEAETARQNANTSLTAQQIEAFYKVVLADQAENKRLRERQVEMEAELEALRCRIRELETQKQQLEWRLGRVADGDSPERGGARGTEEDHGGS